MTMKREVGRGRNLGAPLSWPGRAQLFLKVGSGSARVDVSSTSTGLCLGQSHHQCMESSWDTHPYLLPDVFPAALLT